MYNRKSKKPEWTHWLSVLNSQNRSNVKTAELGGDGQDIPFEQAFSNLAHAYLRDKAPTLLDHEIGFQLLDRNRENTKAVGVFAFKVGSNWLYAPVFFLNGDLKGHELLYIKNQDMFVPLKENWINYIINRKPNILGNGVDRNLASMGQRQPDFTQLSRSPAKFGSAQPTLKQMMTAVLPTLAKTATMNTSAALAELGATFDFEKFVKSARLETLNVLVKSMQHAPQLASAVETFHGLNLVKEAIQLAKARANAPKINSVLDSRTANVKKAANNTKLQIFGKADDSTLKDLPPGTSEEDHQKLLRDGVLIHDERGDDEVSIPYNIQTVKKFWTPNRSGLFDILVKPGELERCYVAVFPQGAAKRENFVTVVRVDGKPDWINTRADQVFAFNAVEGEEFDEWFDALPAASSVSKSGRYMAISRKGDCTVPFRVIREYGEDEFGTTSYEVHLEDYSKFPPKGSISPCCYTDPLKYDKYRDGVRIHLNAKKGSSLRVSMGDIFVPEDFKLLKVAPGEDDVENATDQNACSCGESDNPPLQPGNLLDAQMSLMSKMASVTVTSTGNNVEINTWFTEQKRGFVEKEISEKAALVSLVGRHGLREKAAREILAKAAKNKKFHYHVKYANPYGAPMMVNEAPAAPALPDPVMGGESIMGTSVPTQLGIDMGMPVPGMSASQTDRSVYNPNTMLDDPSIRKVIDAAQSGQREIFDTAMVGTMLRAVRDDSMIDRYMGDLTKGLDKLGRILFMFYWHGDRFAERYGKADMPELEDSLRNAFEMLGDVILFLKQKTIEPYPEEAATDIDLGAVANS